MKLSSMYAVRCGCYQSKYEAQRTLDRLSQRYFDAIMVNTYSYRFGNNVDSERNFRDPIPKRKKYQDDSFSHDSFSKRYNAIDLGEQEREQDDNDNDKQESSFDNNYDTVDDLSEYGYDD